jgi:hypothetical protein
MNNTSRFQLAGLALGITGSIMMLLPMVSLAAQPDLSDQGRRNLIQLITIGMMTASAGGGALALDQARQI